MHIISEFYFKDHAEDDKFGAAQSGRLSSPGNALAILDGIKMRRRREARRCGRRSLVPPRVRPPRGRDVTYRGRRGASIRPRVHCEERRLGGHERIARLRGGARGDLARGQAVELVPGDLRGGRDRGVPDGESAGGGHIVENLVSGDLQARAGPEPALLAEGDDPGVVRHRPLLDDVVLDQRVAAVRQVDAVARRAARSIVDPRVLDGGSDGPALDLVSDIRAVEIAVVDDQRAAAGIEIVRIAITGRAWIADTVIGEFAVVDGDGVAGSAAKQAILVIEEIVVVEG